MAQDHLQRLPVEILIQIFQSFSSPADFHTLSSLSNTSRLLASIFDNHAVEIVDTLIHHNSKWFFLPDVMRMVIYIRSGVFKRRAWDMDLGRQALMTCPQKNLITSLILRRFLRLAAKIHVLAHVCMDRWLHLCRTTMIPALETVIKEEGKKEGGDRSVSHDEVVLLDPLPTWAEEHRVLISLWLVQYIHELKIARLKGRLQEGWEAEDLSELEMVSWERADRYWNWGGYSTVVEHHERMGTLRDTLAEIQREGETEDTNEQKHLTASSSSSLSASALMIKSLRLPDPGRNKNISRQWETCHNSAPSPRLNNTMILSFYDGLLEQPGRWNAPRTIRDPLPKGLRRFGLYFWDWTRITHEIRLWPPDTRTPQHQPRERHESWDVYLSRLNSCKKLLLTAEEIKQEERDNW